MQKQQYAYIKIYEDLKAKIDFKILKPGQKLETEFALKNKYEVSRVTIRRALDMLEQEGYITRRAALGTFVNQNKSDYTLSKMTGFSEQMKAKGIKPSSDIISIELINHSDLPPIVIEKLSPSEQEKIYKVSRIRKADGEPMAYEITYVPYRFCPELQIHLNSNASLYEVYEKEYQISIGRSHMSFEAELPSPLIQKKLKMQLNKPVLKMHCTAFTSSHFPFYFVVCYYIGDKYLFTTHMQR